MSKSPEEALLFEKYNTDAFWDISEPGYGAQQREGQWNV